MKEKGLGLVEVMLAVAVSGGLALTIAKLMDNTAQNTKQLEAKSEVIHLKGNIASILSNQSACVFTFGSSITQGNLVILRASPTNSIVTPNIKNKVNEISYSLASTNIAPLKITSFALTNFNPGTNTADLAINMNFRRSSIMVQSVKPIFIPLNFNIDESDPSNPTLIGCSTLNVGGGQWLLTGNAAIDPAINYIGTSDNQPLIFKVDAQPFGKLASSGTVGLGLNAANGTGANNIALGSSVLSVATGGLNVGIGNTALTSNTSGSSNIAIGSGSMRFSTTGTYNISFGRNALRNSTTGNYIIAIGDSALSNAIGTGQTNNMAIGASSLEQTTTGTNNTALGMGALRFNTTGSDNTALGLWALAYTSTGAQNVGIGKSALISTTAGNNNVCVGGSCIHDNTNRNSNTGIGTQVLQTNTTGSENVAIGVGAGNNATTGDMNIYLGSWSGPPTATTGSRNIFIGHRAGLPASAATANDMFYLTNLGTTKPLMQGSFTSKQIYIPDNFRVGSFYPITAVGTVYSGTVVLGDGNTTPIFNSPLMNDHTFYARFNGGYYFRTSSANNTLGAKLENGTSAWAAISDRNMKHDIRRVDVKQILEKVKKLDVYHWKYNGYNHPHMGPMAQDFWNLFRLGTGDDKSISTQDMDGVLISAVKGLDERTRDLMERNKELHEKNIELELRLITIEKLLFK